VLQVLGAVRRNFVIGKAWMAREFLDRNTQATKRAFGRLASIGRDHLEFKKRVRWR
jgi:hypothetical protein